MGWDGIREKCVGIEVSDRGLVRRAEGADRRDREGGREGASVRILPQFYLWTTAPL